jgi:hypothetical protein
MSWCQKTTPCKGSVLEKTRATPSKDIIPKAKKGDANQDSMLKQKKQPKRAQKCALGKIPHFCLGPIDEEQPSKKKTKLIVGVESNSSNED